MGNIVWTNCDNPFRVASRGAGSSLLPYWLKESGSVHNFGKRARIDTSPVEIRSPRQNVGVEREPRQRVIIHFLSGPVLPDVAMTNRPKLAILKRAPRATL